MSGSAFALPSGFTIGAAPPTPPPQVAPVATAQSPDQAAAPPANAPADPYALPQGFTVGATPPAPAPSSTGATTQYIDVSLSGQDADQSNKPSVPDDFTSGQVGPRGPGLSLTGQAVPPPPAPLPSSAPPQPVRIPGAPPGSYIPAANAGSTGAVLPSDPIVTPAHIAAYSQPQPTPAASVSLSVPPGAALPAAQGTPAASPPLTLWQAQYSAARARTAAQTGSQPATVDQAGQPPAPQPTPGFNVPYLEHVGSLLGRDALEGTSGVVTGPLALAARGIDYATGSQALAPVANAPQWVSQQLTDAGFAQPQNTAERYGSAIAENIIPALATGGLGAIPGVARAAETLPSAVQSLGHLLFAPGISTGTKLAAGTGAGVLQQGAADAGAGTRAQLVAALLGGVAGGGLAGATRGYGARLGVPFTGGREMLAGQALLSRSSDPASFNARLGAGIADQQAGNSTARLPGSPATPGMLANDQNMMAFEQGVRNNTTGNDAYRHFDQARAQSQIAAIRDLADPTMHSPEERGFTIRNALDQAHGASAARTSQLYHQAAPTAASLPLDTVHAHVSNELNGTYGPGSGGPPAPIEAVWRELAQRRELPSTTLMRMSTRLGNIAGQLKMAGDRVGASAAMRTRDAIEDVAGSPAWEQARAARREQGEAFGRNQEGANAAGAIRAEDRYGSPMMADGKVADRALKDAGSVRQVHRALNKGIVDARAAGMPSHEIARLQENARDVHTALREHFIDGLMRKGSVVRDDDGHEILTITPKQWQNYWRDHADVADHLFGPDERRAIDADFAEQQRFIDAGKANGSNTMKNAATARFLHGLEAGKIPGELRTVRLLAAGVPLAVAKGSTHALNLIAPGLGHGIEHAAHQGAEYYFLTRGGHGAAHSLLGGVVNPGASHVAETVREAAGDPDVVRALTSRVGGGARSRIAAAVSPRPLRMRTRDLIMRRVVANSPAIAQAQQGPALAVQ